MGSSSADALVGSPSRTQPIRRSKRERGVARVWRGGGPEGVGRGDLAHDSTRRKAAALPVGKEGSLGPGVTERSWRAV